MNDNFDQQEDEGKLTKTERKQQRREEKQLERERQKRAKARRRMLTWLVLVVVVIAVIGGSVGLVGRDDGGDADSGHDSDGEETSLRVAVSSDDWIKGNAEAETEFVEYGDFQCPACGQFHPIIKDLSEEFGDRVKFVYRHFPLRQAHPNAEPAAIAAEAAGRQDKFWEMHDLLFERQTDWSQGNPQETFISYAEELGLNRDQFIADLEDSVLEDKVDEQYTGGVRSSVNATPTFFLNGEKLEGYSTLDEFRSHIAEAAGESS